MKRITLCALLITLFLFLSCGSGHQSAMGGGAATGGSSLSSVLMDIGRSAENAFYSFLELLSDTLGFTAKSTTKKNDVGSYFNGLGEKLGVASEELEQVAVKATAGVDTSDASKDPIRVAIETAKATLITLKTHLESLKDIGDGNIVGHAHNAQGAGTKADDAESNKFLKALQEIVKVATDVGVTALKAGATTLQANGGEDNKDGAKILATSAGNPAAADVAKAAAILATVSGEEILASIVASQEGDVKAVTAAATANTTSLEFAKGGTADNLAKDTAKAAAVAGGIALRSLVKTGKLAAGAADNATGGEKEVQGVGITAVNKLLVAVEDIIKKTVKNVLEKAKGEIDKARAPKTAAHQ
ncbi:variable large family protein [Borrelia puertoricensis]|uniref:variable large family protein n=1 Tax=Borrelia puertoricensis TaxID=2756107 RepID=UPI003D311256|nr:variable large family protein [Borrelia puertoricensis]UPA19343.1 variable large family protein [Borrelia puertoricensis]